MVTSSRTPTVPMTTEAVGAVVAVARHPLLLTVGVAVIALSAATCLTSKVESLAPNLRA